MTALSSPLSLSLSFLLQYFLQGSHRPPPASDSETLRETSSLGPSINTAPMPTPLCYNPRLSLLTQPLAALAALVAASDYFHYIK